MNQSNKESDQKRIVYIEDNFIIINAFNEYPIEVSRCDSSKKILAWVHHLTEKTSMTNEILRLFVTTSCKANNIELPRV